MIKGGVSQWDTHVTKLMVLRERSRSSREEPDVQYQVLSKTTLSEPELRDGIIVEWKNVSGQDFLEIGSSAG